MVEHTEPNATTAFKAMSSILELNKNNGRIMRFDMLCLKLVKRIDEALTVDLHVNDKNSCFGKNTANEDKYCC